MRASINLTKKGVKRARNGGFSKIVVNKQLVEMVFGLIFTAVYRQLNYFLS